MRRLATQSQTPPAGHAAAAPPTTSQSLQADLANLRAELAGLKVESDRLQGQLKQASGYGLPTLQARATEVGLDIARVEGSIAQIQMRIANQEIGRAHV